MASEVVEYEGSRWQLKVYPNGNAQNHGNLSVLLKLLSNPDEIDQYDVQIELAHPSDPCKNILKEHQAVFRIGESWGYGKLVAI